MKKVTSSPSSYRVCEMRTVPIGSVDRVGADRVGVGAVVLFERKLIGPPAPVEAAWPDAEVLHEQQRFDCEVALN